MVLNAVAYFSKQLDAALAHLVLGHAGIVDEQRLGKLVANGEHGRKGRERVLPHLSQIL